MSRIRVLPDDLINQIAAGEVIERPASVVKELIENAIDAGARSIVIDVEGGGRRRIRVADDGEGLDRDDALLALERHATSKLRDAAGLAGIATLGFRGEALPAIASVCRLTLTSSRDGRTATRVEVEGGRIRRVDEAGHPRGTTMDVRDLFFNTPARAKFLKSPPTELGHISELVAACAVTVPGVAVTLSHEGRRLLEAPVAPDENERIRQVFGEAWRDAVRFEAARGPFALRGLLSAPRASESVRRAQRLYVNGRLVRDRLVGHAVAAACRSFLPKDWQVPLFLFITCPPESVDVNVHPSKAEVRFPESRLVHDLVYAAVLDALRGALPVTALAAGVGVAASDPVAGAPSGPDHRAIHEATRAYLAREPSTRVVEPRGHAAPELPSIADGPVALAHYRESYIVAADGEGLLIVDQHAAHERILYERIVEQAESDKGPERQRLLFPFTTELPRALAPRCGEILAEVERLGFGAEPFGDGTLVIAEAPAALDAAGLPALMDDLFQQMLDEDVRGTPALPRRQKLFATVACHAAIKVPMPLTHEKMNYLIKELFRTQAPLKCPHGRPAVLRFTQPAIEKGFERR